MRDRKLGRGTGSSPRPGGGRLWPACLRQPGLCTGHASGALVCSPGGRPSGSSLRAGHGRTCRSRDCGAYPCYGGQRWGAEARGGLTADPHVCVSVASRQGMDVDWGPSIPSPSSSRAACRRRVAPFPAIPARHLQTHPSPTGSHSVSWILTGAVNPHGLRVQRRH